MSRAGARASAIPASLEDLRRFMEKRIELIGRDFKTPEDDWRPMLIIQTPKEILPLPLPNELMATGARKNALVALMKQVLAELGALRYGVLLNVHAINDDQVTAEQKAAVNSERLRIEQLPGAVERLNLIIGDAESEESWLGEIVFDEQGVRRLGSWERMDAASGRFTGFADVLRRGNR